MWQIICALYLRTALTDFTHHLEARPPVVQAAAMGTMASGVGTRANYAEVSMHLVQTISKEGSYYFFVVSDLVRLVLCSFWCCCCRQAPLAIGMGTRSSYPEALCHLGPSDWAPASFQRFHCHPSTERASKMSCGIAHRFLCFNLGVFFELCTLLAGCSFGHRGCCQIRTGETHWTVSLWNFSQTADETYLVGKTTEHMLFLYSSNSNSFFFWCRWALSQRPFVGH